LIVCGRNFDLIDSIDDHSAAVTSIKISSNGCRILSCSADRYASRFGITISNTLETKEGLCKFFLTVEQRKTENFHLNVLGISRKKNLNIFTLSITTLLGITTAIVK